MYKIAKTHMDMGHGLVGHAQEHGDHEAGYNEADEPKRAEEEYAHEEDLPIAPSHWPI